jgi:cellulose synthase/poly-beta-1,6-N-acetylglucosamine synthase-like glycosyltransferase
VDLIIWILFSIGVGLIWLGLHPWTTYPLSLWLIRAWHRRSSSLPTPQGPVDDALKTFALCCCAYNEERVIGDKITNSLALRQTHPELQILAYVDAATDRTAALLRKHESDIRLFVSPQRAGKTHGMNQLVDLADASILVFTDANVMIDSSALTNLQRYFTDPEIGCVCGHLRYVNANAGATAVLGAFYWRFEEWLKQLETDTGSAMGADGSLFAIRRSLSRPVPQYLIDDMFVSLSILCDGYRVVRAPDVIAYELSATTPGDEFRRKVRIACQAFNVNRQLWPRLRQLDPLNIYKYVSHKLLRWLSGGSLALGGVFTLLALAAAGLPGIALAALLLTAVLALLGWCRYGKWPSRFWDVVSGLGGTVLGVWYSLRGADFQVWEPAQSARE